MKHPAAVTACNMELENLITDSNRSIATLAITTLLKVGNSSVILTVWLDFEILCTSFFRKDISSVIKWFFSEYLLQLL